MKTGFCVFRLQGSSGSPFSGSEGRALQAGSETPGDAADEEDEQDGAGVLPSREQLQAYLSEMLLSPMDGEEEVDRDLPQYASLEECAEALKQCGIGLRSAHQQLFPTAVQSLVVVAAMAVAHWEWWLAGTMRYWRCWIAYQLRMTRASWSCTRWRRRRRT